MKYLPTCRLGRSKISTWATLALALGLLASFSSVVLAQTEQTPSASVTDSPSQPSTWATLDAMASRGQFGAILDHLEQDHTIASDDSSLQQLEANLTLYQQHQALHASTRLKKYNDARSEMTALMAKGLLEQALGKAINAQSQMTSDQALLQDADFITLVNRSKAAAQVAQDQGDWLTALTIWQSLDTLFTKDSTYHDPLQNAEVHVRLLRLYAPDELQRLYIKRETARGNATPEPLILGTETWQERLSKVRIGMLLDAVREAKNRHIDNPSYARLMKGMVDRLTLLTKTAGLRTTFPTLGDADKVKPFVATLTDINKTINQLGDQFSYPQLTQAIGSILSENKSSLSLPEPLLIYEMTEGAMSELDPFSAVIWPEELSQFSRTTEGKFSGVGIQISRPGRLTVASVAAKSQAELAGIKKDDLLTRINGKDTTPMSITAALQALSASGDHQDMTIEVARPGHAGVLRFTLQSDATSPALGLQLSRPGSLTVISPLAGTPAQRAGIKPNDEITQVDGADTTDWSLDQAVSHITGPEGSHVVLTIKRANIPTPLKFDLVRTSIEIDSIRGWQLLPDGQWNYYIDPARQIGYIRLSQFIPKTSEDLDKAFEEMNRKGHVQAVILDLRYDPGGLLRSAADVANRFIASGRIVSTVNAQGRTTSQYTAQASHALRQIPMVVLVNQSSASASEIVSGALQDYHRALVVGARSYGKGSVQDLTPIDGGRAILKLTTQHYKLPSGRIIHRKPKATTWGIEPDLHILMTDQEAYQAVEMRRDLDILHDPADDATPDQDRPQASDILTKGIDPQLEAALMYLRVRLAGRTALLAKQQDSSDGLVVSPEKP